MQISHEEAHTLIQFSLDRDLDSTEETALSAHLRNCTNCVLFKDDLLKVETSLYKLSARYKETHHIPIAIGMLTRAASTKDIWPQPAAMASLIVLIIFILTWQFSGGNRAPNSALPHPISPIPTPSVSATGISLTSQGCKKINYIIQEGDTLISIANFFKVSLGTMKSHNDLSAADLKAGAEVVILLCSMAPSETVDPFMSTITLTSTALLVTLTH